MTILHVVRQPERPTAARWPQAATTGFHILSVGRGERITHAMQMLRIGGLSVRHEQVRRLEDALPRLKAGTVDVVLLDLDQTAPVMPQEVRDFSALAPQVPFIILAEAAQEAAAVEAVRAGAQDYLIGEHLTPVSAARAVRCAVERHRHLADLRDQSLRDPLTGLYNRRGFVALANTQLRMARRGHRHCLLICADLDHLKTINDTWGHEAGDRAVVAAAKVLLGSIRDSDIVARFGGDEFVALAYDAGSEALPGVVGRIEQGLREVVGRLTLPHPLGLSLGAVEFDGGTRVELSRLIEQADRALYREKEARRGADVPGTVRRPNRRSGATRAPAVG